MNRSQIEPACSQGPRLSSPLPLPTSQEVKGFPETKEVINPWSAELCIYKDSKFGLTFCIYLSSRGRELMNDLENCSTVASDPFTAASVRLSMKPANCPKFKEASS